ncbi:hypothetical protein DPMN_127442 [Dreissena polymorpha]|uniref:Uncharacterized protein n=1 Tax=Dreissena polymorpha TaxID=45954 RepID=A0A9D4JYT6_DREPO|nr:hypothetical protein DPMN_127442 [Dreissena polymorpha]
MLEGEAARTIEGCALTNANYGQAISFLTERYGDKHKIIAAYMSTLLQLLSPSGRVYVDFMTSWRRIFGVWNR